VTGHGTVAWTIGLSLIGGTLVIHSIGLVWIGVLLTRVQRRAANRATGAMMAAWSSAIVIGVAGAAIATLHAIEAALWAVTYHWLGALDTWSDAMLYSVDSMTTRGGAGLVLDDNWRMLGALEASAGMLLFGISTAFLFAALQRVWTSLIGPAEHSASREFNSRQRDTLR
jgi:hypothetical protein